MIIRYFRILSSLVSISFKRYLENRVNTVGTIFTALIAFFLSIFWVNIVFSFTQELGGWNKNQVLFLLGLSRISLCIFYILFQRGVAFLFEYIRSGNLDLLLTKPINTQFYVSFRLTRPFEIANVLTGLVLVCYTSPNLNLDFSFLGILILIIGLICGIIIFYALYFIIATLSIWLKTFYSLPTIYAILVTPLSLPTNIYGTAISFLLTYVLPLGMIVYLPVEIFLRQTYQLVLIELMVAVILLLLSILFWNFSLKYYTSASS